MFDSYREAGVNFALIEEMKGNKNDFLPDRYVTKRVTYTFTNDFEVGRLYSVGYSLQDLNPSLRTLIFPGYIELSLVTSVPVFLFEYAISEGLDDKTPLLKELILTKKKVFAKLYGKYFE